MTRQRLESRFAFEPCFPSALFARFEIGTPVLRHERLTGGESLGLLRQASRMKFIYGLGTARNCRLHVDLAVGRQGFHSLPAVPFPVEAV